jgi:hypothetical protein
MHLRAHRSALAASGGVDGWEWIFVVLALLADVASHGGASLGRLRGAY